MNRNGHEEENGHAWVCMGEGGKGTPWGRLKVDKLLGTLFGARYSQGFFLVVVKVARIAGAFAFGQKRRFDLLNRREKG